MSSKLRIAVADDEPDMREYFEKILSRMGHQVVSVAENGRELVEHCRVLLPDLVITDIKMPELDGIQASEELYRETATPVILVSAYHDHDLIDRAEADHIMAYLVKPIKQADLEATIGLAMRRFRQFQEVQKEAADLRQALEDRKLIERAKGIVMKRTGMEEPDAFHRLQCTASKNNQKLVDVARCVITAEDVFGKGWTVATARPDSS